MRHVSRVEIPGSEPRMTSECDTCPGLELFPAKAFPGDHPGHSVSTPRVPGVFPSPPILENTRKMSRTLQIHRNSSFSQKNPKPIFTVSSSSNLTNKIDRA